MKVGFHTLGCKTNAYETQAIKEQFQTAGFEVGEFSEPCDVYVVNTCAVTAEAARKSRQMTARCKKLNPDAIVVMAGCYANELAAGGSVVNNCEAYGSAIGARAARQGIAYGQDTGVHAGHNGITGGRAADAQATHMETASEEAGIGKAVLPADIVAVNSDKARILEMVLDAIEPGSHFSTQFPAKTKPSCQDGDELKITGQDGHVRAYVKIQDGCDRFCSYCVIPFLRGRTVSRKTDNIISEVRALGGTGYKEIVLTGIDISSYDGGSGSKKDRSGKPLAELVSGIAQINGIERIRLGSLEVGIISEDVIGKLKDIPSFCPHFHLSLQSGSDTVLKRMNRHYTASQFKEAVDIIRKYYPDAGITTDIIAGFPGETEDEFEETLDFIKDIGFSRIHAFPFSRRKGTAADKMAGQLPRKIKEERTRIIIAEGERLREEYERRLMGINVSILAEEYVSIGAERYICGYTPEYVKIYSHTADRRMSGDEFVNNTLNVCPCSFSDGRLFANPLNHKT